MPLYEYKCQSCELTQEFVQKFSDPPLTTCPKCQGALIKLMSLGSFALKGAGWYTTDYKRAAPVQSSVETPGVTPPIKADPSPDSKKPDAAVATESTKKTEVAAPATPKP